MIILTDELIDAIAEEYIKKGNKAMTFEQYLQFKINIIKGELANGKQK